MYLKVCFYGKREGEVRWRGEVMNGSRSAKQERANSQARQEEGGGGEEHRTRRLKEWEKKKCVVQRRYGWIGCGWLAGLM